VTRKLGLGLSAAEAVATLALRYECVGISWEEQRAKVLEDAMTAHRRAQGGAGSGADVAACASPGPVRFCNREGEIRITPLDDAKCAVPLHLLWTGVSANTRELVRLFQAWAGQEGAAVEAKLTKLHAASEELSQAWFQAAPPALFEQMDRFDTAIRECTEEAGVPYMLPVHARMAIWARRHGGRAKPTGAGGGDMILLAGELPLDQLKGLVIPLSV
jgi:phosphomevalonate kinase